MVVYFYTFIWLHADSLPFFSGFRTLLCNVSLSSPLHEDPGTHSQGGRQGDSNSAIELVPWSGHLLPVRKNNRKWLTRLPSRTPLLACGNADGIVHNNTVHVRRHRVSKYTTLTKSCFVLRKQDMNHQQREKACHSFYSGFCVASGGTSTPRGRMLEAEVRFDCSFKYLSAYVGL